jgi:protein-S-isoprenylcysteine O-methyltransferase Ste14
MKLLNKKAQSGLGIVVGIAVALLVITIVVAVAAYVSSEFGEEMPDDSAAQNITEEMTDTVAILPSWTKIFVIVLIGVGLIAAVAGVAYMFGNRM